MNRAFASMGSTSNAPAALTSAQDHLAIAELRFQAANDRFDALGLNVPATGPRGPVGIHINDSSNAAPRQSQASHNAQLMSLLTSSPAPQHPLPDDADGGRPAGDQWFTVSASGPHDAASGAYQFSNAGWFVLPDGMRLPPHGWQRSGDLFIQPETGYAIDQVGHLDPVPSAEPQAEPQAVDAQADSQAGEDGTVHYTITADMFGLYIQPAGGGAPVTHIPLVSHAESPGATMPPS